VNSELHDFILAFVESSGRIVVVGESGDEHRWFSSHPSFWEVWIEPCTCANAYRPGTRS
jgi:hypothetical protein